MSTQREIGAAWPSEPDAWNGAIVRLGRQAAVPTPLRDIGYRCLLPSEWKARGRVQFAA